MKRPWLVLIALLLAAGCAAQQPTPPAGSGGPAGSVAVEDFELTLYQGEEDLGLASGRFSQLFGRGKPVVLNFWAGLCPPCRAEMPALERLYQEHKGEFVLFGLDVGPYTGLGTQEDGRALLDELGVTFPAGFTEDGTVVRRYQIQGMPTTIFFDASGRIIAKHTGLLTEGQLRQQMDRLLSGS